jgi:Icc-related predicted phosphoesterase
VTIRDVTFLGGTLWTSLDKNNPIICEYTKKRLNDFRYITNGYTPITCDKWIELHNNTVNYLKQELLNRTNKTVVVTHHSPSYQSVSEIYKGDDLNHAFASDLSDIMLDYNPKLWIHGHMHNSSNYMIGNTNVICNPYGYYGKSTNSQFNPTLTLSL